MSLLDEVRDAQIRAGEAAVTLNLERLGLIPQAEAQNDGPLSLMDMANHVCQHLPGGWQMDLRMERGAAWVILYNPDGDVIDLPDADDKSLEHQINEALCIARG